MTKKLSEKKFLLVDDSDDALEVIELFIESEFDNDLITANSGNEALDLLKADQEYGIIICDYNMPNGNGEEVYKYLLSSKFNIPFILLCGEDKDTITKIDAFKDLTQGKATAFISKPFKKADIIGAIHQNFMAFEAPVEKGEQPQKDADSTSTTTDISGIKGLTAPSGYNKVSIDKFFKFNIKRLSVYIKLSEEKFIKIIEEDDTDPKEIIEKYARKGVKYLFLKAEEYKIFLDSVNETLSEILIKSNQKIEAVIEAQYQSIESIHESLANLGLNSAAMEMADKAVESTIKTLKKASNLSILINQMVKNKNYIYDLKHSERYEVHLNQWANLQFHKIA